MKDKGLLIVFTGASGVGKGTIMKKLLELDKTCRLSVSATTRQPRPGEIDGREYFFLTKEEFEKEISNDGFFEYARYCDNYYGTPKSAVEKMLNDGFNVFLEIEVQGGLQVMEKYPDCISIFVLPPSMEELEKRLRGRATETEEVINKRLNAALTEINFAEKYSYSVVNDDVDTAVKEILDIISKNRQN